MEMEKISNIVERSIGNAYSYNIDDGTSFYQFSNLSVIHVFYAHKYF